MATSMSDEARRAFLMHSTRTAAVATVRKDGTPHVAPVWFVLDDDTMVFMTNRDTVKGRALRRTGRAALSVDDGVPPFSFVTVAGPVELSEDLEAMLPWSIAIGRRYMGEERAEEFGRRNAAPGEMLVRLAPEQVVALAELAD